MDKQMLRTTITQCRQIALFALGVSLLTACGNSQSGMKLGDSEYAVLTVNSSSSNQGIMNLRSLLLIRRQATRRLPIRPRSEVRRISRYAPKFRVLLLSYVSMKELRSVKISPCLKLIPRSIRRQ